MRKKLVLIDGHALAYRAYHAIPFDLTTSKGELTNAVYGFTSMLLDVLEGVKPDYVAVAFDVGRTFRHEEYEYYKVQRAKMPNELKGQMERIREVINALDIPIVEVEGYEADDVLGTLARQAKEKGLETIIVTGDSDVFQLIDESTKVLISRRRFSQTIIYDEEGIERRYGLKPKQLVDYKALVGDSSDNIPGVKGVGEKTAKKLLKKYKTLEGIYDHLDEVKEKRFKNALERGRDRAFLSRRLSTIVKDVPVTLDLNACRMAGYDHKKVLTLFRELEFRSLMRKLPKSRKEDRATPRQMALFEMGEKGERRGAKGGEDYRVVESREELDELVGMLAEEKAFAFDVETTSADPMASELVGISFCFKEGKAHYVPMLRDKNYALGKLKPLLENPKIQKYAHNSKYDFTVLANYGIWVKGLAFDTMIAEWLINPASKNLSLKNLAWARLGVEMKPITDLIGKGKKQISMALVPIHQAARYSCTDVDMTYRLVKVLGPELEEKGLWPLFAEVEMPLVPVLAEMEMRGVKLDSEYLAEMSRELERKLHAIERDIQDLVGYNFNINSTQQLSDALFIKLGLPTQGIPKTKSGHYSTSALVLEKLKGKHPIIDLILEHREISKLKSTYVDALPLLVNKRTGRVHTSFNQTGTVTGRLSSSEPNLQNIPIRTELGRRVRRAFIADDGRVLLSADYSQIELRILAHISQDPTLLEAFSRGEDIHSSTASVLFDVPLKEVTPSLRRLAKTINYGITYGMSGYGLAQRAELPQEEAEGFIKSYFAKYPKVKRYVVETKRKAKEQGYVETLLKRRRYFPELMKGSKAPYNVRSAAERMAINMRIQGTAADIIKIAMVRLDKALKERGLRSRMILQVHDELVLEVPEEELEEAKYLVKSTMESAFELDAPLKVDMKVGRNWLEMS
jgi:DNA polymerase-1